MRLPEARIIAVILTLTTAAICSMPTAAETQEKAATTSRPADGGDRPYRIGADGKVDWAVFNGFRRYNSICNTCHGPDGAGSSFAPALVDSLKRLSYDQFLEIVVNGKEEVNTAAEKKMPMFGTNPNVMCYIDDIYAYLKARSDGALGRGRPPKHEDKPAEAAEAEKSCMGG
ncbi:MAG TPA: c-type cytochrome, methanol metabolism-related [Ferrovibrio sp.]|uniref:c-type cytochrome, methanol metabolism-related n=1 Tax=Ferrovibrio sp. TaxID=1917215 RepID=UPI002ED49040